MKRNDFRIKGLLAGVVLMSGLLASCEPSAGESSQTITYTALNFISFNDGKTPILSWGDYTFHFNYTEQKESVMTSNITVDNTNYGFATNGVPYEDISPSKGMGVYAGGFLGNVGQSTVLEDCKFYLSSFPIPNGMTYVPSKNWIPMVTETDKDGKETKKYHPGAFYEPSLRAYPPIVVGRYSIGNLFDVVTCNTDMSFFGETVTQYPGGEFKNSSMVYRLFLDIKNQTADVVIYDAKFAEQAPSLAVVYLPSLPLILKDGNYEIFGTNVVPKVPEGSGSNEVLVDYPQFVFKSFKWSTVDGTYLSKAKLTYEVGAAFSAEFNGQYVELPSKMLE